MCAGGTEDVASQGGIVLDNSEGFWGTEGSYPVIELFEREGFLRVDFYGFAPGSPSATARRYSSGTMRAYSAT